MNPVSIFFILAAATVSVAFTITYLLTSSWHRSLMGRSLMVNSASISAVMLLIVLAVLFPEATLLRDIGRVILYPTVFAGQLAYLIGYAVTFARSRAEDKEGPI